MLLIPAIDLKEGHCVRLRQGVMDDAQVFSDSPAEMAKHWQDLGAKRLHLVDLDGAFAGNSVNAKAIQDILAATGGLPIQLGGGIRDEAAIEAWLDAGVEWCIIGTQAVTEPDFVRRACRLFAGHVMVGIDTRDGKVAIKGWAETTDVEADTLIRQFEDAGVSAIIHTDIGRDGMMSGPNLEATKALAGNSTIPCIVSGGMSTLQDVEKVAKAAKDGANIAGAITGRAIYEGTLDFAAGQTLVDRICI